MSGKGSGRRPTLVTDEAFEEDWEAIFKRSTKNAKVMKGKHKEGEEDEVRRSK